MTPALAAAAAFLALEAATGRGPTRSRPGHRRLRSRWLHSLSSPSSPSASWAEPWASSTPSWAANAQGGSGDKVFALSSTARITLEVELGRSRRCRRRLLQAAVGGRLRPRGERPAGAPRGRRARHRLEAPPQVRRVRLRVADRRGRRLRGPGHDGPPDRLGAEGARLRPAAARRDLQVRGRQAPALLHLRLQAGRVLAVPADGEGSGARQRRRARAEGKAGERAADGAGSVALVRDVRRSALAARQPPTTPVYRARRPDPGSGRRPRRACAFPRASGRAAG